MEDNKEKVQSPQQQDGKGQSLEKQATGTARPDNPRVAASLKYQGTIRINDPQFMI